MGVDYKVDKGLLVKEVVVASLFLDFEQNEKKEITHTHKKISNSINLFSYTANHIFLFSCLHCWLVSIKRTSES